VLVILKSAILPPVLKTQILAEISISVLSLKLSYTSVHLRMHELPPPLLFPVLECINVEVDGAVEGGEEVAGGGDVGQPVWPG
jgi:hypothetical protein